MGHGHAQAAFIHEYTHPVTAVQFHPRGGEPFRLSDLDRALERGASAAELDLRWRAADSSIVCAHDRSDRACPTLEEALATILRFQGERHTVRGDGLQFFLVLDLKDERPAFHRMLVRVLREHAEHFANSGSRESLPRGITVVISGFRAALERSIPAAVLDSLCVLEGRDYGARIRAVEGPSRFQWLPVEYPVDRERVLAIHEGRDPRARGRFNVRVVAAGAYVERAVLAGADAVNADLDEIERAVLASRAIPAGKRRR